MGTYVLKLDETQNRWIVASLHRKQDKKNKQIPIPRSISNQNLGGSHP